MSDQPQSVEGDPGETRERPRPTQSAPQSIERWGWASIGVNIGLTGLNFYIARASSSLAVSAEMVHNLVDLMASIAVLAGLKLSRRKSRRFPYGLYKVENLVAASVALLIFLAAYEIGREAFLAETTPTVVTPWILGGVGLSLLIPLVFSLLEMRAGRAVNSPSLMADASEYRVHVLTSGVVLVALVTQSLPLPVDRLAALIVVVVVAKTGWDLLKDAMRVLLDASLDTATLALARATIEKKPSVVAVHSLTGRNAGRYRFLEAEVEVRVRELKQADRIAHRIEQAILEAVPHVERARISVMPSRGETLRLAVPLSGPDRSPSEHFGTAPFFRFIDRRRADGEIVHQKNRANPYAGDPRGRGIKVAHWLIEQGADQLITWDDVREKGPGHALGEAGIELVITEAATLEEALAQSAARH